MSQIQLPPALNKLVQIFGVLGMLIGASLSAYNRQPFGMGVLLTVGIGVIFAFLTKYFIARWMYYWMETKLEVAAKEKEEAKKLEKAKLEERRLKAEEEAIKIRQEAAKLAAAQPAEPPKPIP